MKLEHKYFLIGYLASELQNNVGDADIQGILQQILFDLEDEIRTCSTDCEVCDNIERN